MTRRVEAHAGIGNVKDRIGKMCGGGMILKSRPGEGNAATLLIPEKARGGSKEQGK